MKNLFLKITIPVLALSLIMVPIIKGETASRGDAETIADLRNELAGLKQEKIDIDKAKKQTQTQINSKKNAIYKAYQEQEEIEIKVGEAEQQIIESNEDINEKTAETNELLRFLQISSGENAYLEYIAGSTSTTDLIMRTAIVEEITEYNEIKMNELKTLIEQNEQLKVELEKRNVELEDMKDEYNQALKSLGNKITELNEVNEDINDQIKNQETLIDYYKTLCDSETQKLSDCISLKSATGFIRPTNTGRISSYWGYRVSPITKKVNSFHNAIDIAGFKGGEPVYAAALGMVAAITKKSSCGGNMVYIHHNVMGKAYTTQYAHLATYSVKVGDIVSASTQIGTIGGNKKLTPWDTCTTGAHLHFSITKGHYLGAGPDGYSSWSKFLANSVDPLKYIPNVKSWSRRY